MTDAQTAVRTWNLDKTHSFVEFAVKHMVFATAKGRFSDVAGTISYDPSSLGNSEVDVTIGAASVDTRDEGRDNHLRSADFFNVETFPTITFKSTSVEGNDPSSFKVRGDLTLKGVTRSVVLDAEFNGQGQSPFGFEVISFSATGKINRKDFDLGWNAALETGGVMVSEEVKLSIDVEANPAS